MAETHQSAIEFNHVDYAVNGGRALLRDLNLQIAPQEMLVLLGQGGSCQQTRRNGQLINARRAHVFCGKPNRSSFRFDVQP